MQNCVIYVRVSSREQEREGFSIPAQIELLQDYASRQGFKVVQIYKEVETAKASGRQQFNAMLAFLKKSKTVRTILVEKTDRLYRNFKDYVTLDELDLDIHLVKEGEVLSHDSRSSTKFMHGIRVLMAKTILTTFLKKSKKANCKSLKKAIMGAWLPMDIKTTPKRNRLKLMMKPLHL
jgi:site-specific DNA recombinase